MKGQVMPMMVQMGEEALQNLVTEVKETVAVNVTVKSRRKKFGTVDLWSSQRRARQVTGFLNRWQLS